MSKWYGATRALSDVSLAIQPGRVVALIGHNGAGKSTLLRALSGAETPDEGGIGIDGRPVRFQKPSDAADVGIACVYQELSLIDELTVAENLFLGVEKLSGPLLDRRAMRDTADALCAEYGIAASATDRVAMLPVAQRQLLEVARAVRRNARFLLLDEPTTALEQQQVEALLVVVRRLADRGIGILLIDHKLDEVYAVADDIVGLSNGRIILSGDARQVSREQVVEAIVGAGVDVTRDHVAQKRRFERAKLRNNSDPTDTPVLQVCALAGNGLAGVDLEVHAGEIVGIYGLVGSGRSRFLRTIYGAEPAAEGSMLLGGRPFRPRDPEQAIAAGVAFLSEERKFDGLLPQLSTITNIVTPVLGHFAPTGILRWPALRAAAKSALADIPIRGDVTKPIVSLSGGNQQKALFARALLQNPILLLLDEPTKGVDIGAKIEIYDIIRRLAAQGGAVVVVSSEEEELLEVADRIVVFRDGSCSGIAVPDSELSIERLRRAAWSDVS